MKSIYGSADSGDLHLTQAAGDWFGVVRVEAVELCVAQGQD